MVEEFVKYKKIYVLGHEENENIFADGEDDIVIEEKIDGGNFRFMVKDGKVIIGSRTQQLTSDEGEETNMNKMFRRCADYVKEQLNKTDLTSYSHLLFYGENCVKHTLDYDWDKIPPFLGFDILNLDTGKFVPYPQVEELFGSFGLPFVPVIKVCKAKEITEVNDDLVPVSAYPCPSSKDQKAEGIVFKNYNKQVMAKYVRDAFKEANAKAFGGNPKYKKVDETNNAELVYKYCTNARIDKIIFKLIDEGLSLEMKMMEQLPKRVYEDIIEENWKDILSSNWLINFKKVRKLVNKRCVSVLKQVITNNALNKGE